MGKLLYWLQTSLGKKRNCRHYFVFCEYAALFFQSVVCPVCFYQQFFLTEFFQNPLKLTTAAMQHLHGLICGAADTQSS